MPLVSPLDISRGLLAATGIRSFLYYGDRIPSEDAVLVVSNHRSFLDVPLLMSALGRSVRFACHHYMGQVPLLRQMVTSLGCFPLDEPQQRFQTFFRQATDLLKTRQCVGIFPEGAQPMVQVTASTTLGTFHRGFAHLALRTPVENLAVLPVAIAPYEESVTRAFPLRLLQFFDPSEPLFAQAGWHPLVFYHRVNVLVGRPFWINHRHGERYRSPHGRALVTDLTDYCHQEIQELLQLA